MKTIKEICADELRNGGSVELEQATQRERDKFMYAVVKAMNTATPPEVPERFYKYTDKLKLAAFELGYRTAYKNMLAVLKRMIKADEREGSA